MNILIEKKSKEYILGTYYGQSYKVNLKTKKDELSILTNNEVTDVLNNLEKQKETNPMLSIEIGSLVKVGIEEGHELFEYCLKVTSIEEEWNEDGQYTCIAHGKGVTNEDEELATEFTHRIDLSNFIELV